MNGQHRFEVRAPSKFGIREVFLINLLGLVPSLIAGVLLGVGGVGFPGGIILAVFCDTSYWIVFISLCCLVLGLTMFFFMPAIMFANYYIKALVSHLRPIDGETSYICQVSTLPRSCTGIRAFLEDADDVGFLSIHAGSIEFRGDHSDLTIALSNNVVVELHNVGWRGFWCAGRRVRILLLEHEEIQEIDIAERQSWTIIQSRRLALQIFEAIKSNIRKT